MAFLKRTPAWLKGLYGLGVSAGVIVIVKSLFECSNYKGTEDLTGQTVIITGANSGIGKETAAEFATRNAKVIMACKTKKDCNEARVDIIQKTKNKFIYCYQCDLASIESIQRFAKRINESEHNVKYLINNAGVMRCPKLKTIEGIEMQMGVNHFGHFLLTMLLVDKLKKHVPSRIVIVSSVAHKRGKINFEDLNSEQKYNAAEAYKQSKLANALFALELSEKLKDTGISVHAVHPGLVRTNISRHMSVNWLSPLAWFFLMVPRKGAQTTLYAALSPELEGTTGKYFSRMKEDSFSELCQDASVRARLWAISEVWTGLKALPQEQSINQINEKEVEKQ